MATRTFHTSRRLRLSAFGTSIIMVLSILVFGVIGSVVTQTAAPTVASAASTCSGYYFLSEFDLKNKKGKKSNNYHIVFYKKAHTNKYAIEVEPQQHVAPSRYFYAKVSLAYPNGTRYKLKSDGGKGDGGTDCLTFTMDTNQRYELYGSRASKKGKSASHKRTVIIWRDHDGDVHYSG